ncbi:MULTISPECIES: hypothetical protein [Photorhabdus]|uniref:Uncharacterized protein n=2 Tax=Photorhabdus TaxID=29487 RepID=A0A7X5TM00_9GAMM|nr:MULTISPECIES: hypothetical protein [Photorhabdus]MQL46543.1 hypothetical protein [Photorhabdus khanii]NHB97218.1 hypothetical protein [Photorhabdus stackebrandtii]
MSTAQYKKELLYRKANGKHIIKNYISKVTSLLCIKESNLTFMELKDTDDVLSISGKSKGTDEKTRLTPQELHGFLKELKNDDTPYYIFIDDDWTYCGSFLISSLCSLNENFKFGEKIINDILFISKDFKKNISLDYYEVNRTYFIDVVKSISI